MEDDASGKSLGFSIVASGGRFWPDPALL